MRSSLKVFIVIAFVAGLFYSNSSSAQVTIIEPDTAFCIPQPFTFHADVDSGQTAVGLVIADDTYSELIPLDFPFTFYGNTYNNMYLSTNAYIKFGGGGGYSPWVITEGDAFPTATQSAGGGEMTNVIMGPWHDTYPGVGFNLVDAMDYKTVGTAPNRIFVFSFCEVPMYSCTDLYFSGQILLFETTNIVEVHLNHKIVCAQWNTGQAVLGVQDATGQYATIIPGHNVSTQWTASNEAWRFTPTSDTSYAWDTIPYGPIPIYSGGGVKWYDNGTLIGTGDSVITNLTTGVHQLIAEVNGCYVSTASDTIYITVGGPAIPSQQNVPCSQSANGYAAIAFQDLIPFYGVWTDANGNILSQGLITTTDTVFNLAVGNYTLLISNDSLDCTAEIDYSIFITPGSIIASYGNGDVPCEEATNGFAEVQFATNGTYDIVWTDLNGDTLSMDTNLVDADTLSNLGTGYYTAIVTDELGCTESATIYVNIDPFAIQPVATIEDVECPESNAGSITIQLPSFNSYSSLWVSSAGDTVQHNFTGTDVLQGISDGDYYLLVTDDAGCTAVFNYTVDAGTYVASFTQSTDTICAGEVVTFTNTTNENVTQYTWTYGDGNTDNQLSPVHQFTDAGTYTVSLLAVNSDFGCSATASGTVTVMPIVDADFTTSSPTCVNEVMYFTDQSTANPAQWTWDFGGQGSSNLQSPQFTFTNAGSYIVSVQVVDAYCGTDNHTDTVVVNYYPTLDLGVDTFLCEGQSITFNAGNPGDTYSWNVGGNTQTLTYTFNSPTIIGVVVDHLGCTASDSVFIDIQCEMVMPNAFTPNGDGLNDIFRPRGVNVKSYEIFVYNRWGQLVYSITNGTPDLSIGWDGKINGEEAEIGVYSYFAKGILITDFVMEQNGNVTLIR